ncbi:FAD-dependent oxidoreductase [Sphingopyxis panaciterrulae]|uniref:Fumarate reductase flavoprotein subunit n=1 Tax=Sphingopyxis panaciterrulae TaxID=462372 RepID=A0A7W9ESE3_9SPHN|nr:FAD-dependent oxidoreductase [Sphingopyxis panaciterrulae]MBB5708658.1 fumarate reductase flavoprotein subunit [Sphingopyxis panaciterrulae]
MTEAILAAEGRAFAMEVAVIVVGGGGTGLCAALAAADAGAEVLVIERDRSLLGSTAMSTGLIPAAGTPEQAAAGIEDSPEIFAADILKKTKGRTDPDIALGIARESAATIAWMRDSHGVPLQLIDGFLYPGHSAMRMYGTPHRTGGELMAALESAAEAAGIPILTEAVVESLFADPDGTVRGVRLCRPDGSHDDIGCKALVLACSGFGGAADMVASLIPEMGGATYHGHPGNRGDAIRWGEALGAGMADLAAYQGHGGLAAGHGIPILWPLIMNGGFQVNLAGQRFSNEASGYSEQAARVNAQPERIAWSIFDEQRHQMMLAFEDYQDALRAGAVVEAADLAELAAATKLPLAALEQTVASVRRCVEGEESDPFGRDFTGHPPLEPPYRAARVTGALFHTQGGLCIDMAARVLRRDGSPLPNLLAGGGAARGISGDAAEGYMAGNGLLTATTFGRLAGETAARIISA